MNPTEQLAQIQIALHRLRGGEGGPAQFSTACRDQAALLAALPPKYGEVLHNLLDRLEASALFAEESCSFSQSDLTESLQFWIDKATQQLAAARGATGG